MINKNAADIFLCHSSKDKEFVRKLALDLKELSIIAWFDEWDLEPGDSLLEKIGNALEYSIFIGVVISTNSVKSNWCKKELNQALSRELRQGNKVIIPIKLDNVDIPPFLEEKLYLDFSRDYYSHFTRLCGVIHIINSREININISKSPPRSIKDAKFIIMGSSDDKNKLGEGNNLYRRFKKMVNLNPSIKNKINLGRICYELKRDHECKEILSQVIQNDTYINSKVNLDSYVSSLAKNKKPFELNLETRIALSYMGLVLNDENMVLNSAYDCKDKEVLINAGKFYLDTYNADIPCAIAYFIKATEGESIDSAWVRYCDDLIHQILRDKKILYPKFSWDLIEEYVIEWNSHKWKLI